jgi:hypothetical protein
VRIEMLKRSKTGGTRKQKIGAIGKTAVKIYLIVDSVKLENTGDAMVEQGHGSVLYCGRVWRSRELETSGDF